MSSAIRAGLTPRSIRAQLTLWYLLMTAGALAAFAVFVFLARQRGLERELDAHLEIDGQRLVSQLQPMLLELDLAAALAEEPRIAEHPVIVREPQGALLYRSRSFPAVPRASDAAMMEAARAGADYDTIDDVNGYPMRLLTIVVPRAGTSPVVVQTAASKAAVDSALRQLTLGMLLWSALILAAASYGGRFIARRALEPVDAIVARARAIEPTEMRERLDVAGGSEELDRLVATLNGMLDRIATSMRGARRFAADASHELQTPIASMRAALDACLADDGAGVDDFRAVADDLVAELEQLSSLVRDLRLLALADAGHLIHQVEAVDLGALVLEACEVVRAAAEPKAIDIDLAFTPGVMVRGNPLHLRRAVFNLAHNAVRYSPDGSAVRVAVQAVDAEAVVDVTDRGCGIAAGDLPHIFERFYRADRARARETGGTGLGLAIADQIVRGHGGRIEVTSAVGRGSTFLVFLPLETTAAPPFEARRQMNAA